MKEIEELVEKTAKVIYKEYHKGGLRWSALHEGERNRWRDLARIALSHPNLALIDDEREMPEKPAGWQRECMEFHAGYYRCQQDMLRAGAFFGIRLSEVLKEGK